MTFKLGILGIYFFSVFYLLNSDISSRQAYQLEGNIVHKEVTVNILLEHFFKHKSLFSEECTTSTVIGIF